MLFGIIAEGRTDLTVIESLIGKYFYNQNIEIEINRLRPYKVDTTDSAALQGGYMGVLKYCETSLANILPAFNEGYVVIQLDTDVWVKTMQHRNASDKEVYDKIKNAILGYLPKETDKKNILFAISHESIECWLLPWFFDNTRRNETKNCCEALNGGLRLKGKGTINCKDKKRSTPNIYETICKEFKNREDIINQSQYNHSFKEFIKQLSAIS